MLKTLEEQIHDAEYFGEDIMMEVEMNQEDQGARRSEINSGKAFKTFSELYEEYTSLRTHLGKLIIQFLKPKIWFSTFGNMVSPWLNPKVYHRSKGKDEEA